LEATLSIDLTYAAYRGGAALAGVAPEWLVRRLGEAGGRRAFDRGGRRARMMIRHMARVVGSEHDVETMAREAFAAYGRYWAEVFWIRTRRVADVLANIDRIGVDRVEKVRDEGRGMVYALPHIGNWEVAGTVANDLGLELIAVAEPLPNRKIVDWFIDVRRTLGIDVVLANTPRIMEFLGAAVDRGAAVALVTDRIVRSGGVDVEFFGEVTSMPAGAAALGIRHDVPVFPVAAYFKEGRGHRLVVEAPVPMPETGSEADRIQEGTQRIAQALEALILRAPTQWHIVQPNWPSDRR
jgi:KDO2-lipid IV(A) lauroyltransferase